MSYSKTENTKHLYNICTTFAQKCTNVIQMFRVCWEAILIIITECCLFDVAKYLEYYRHKVLNREAFQG